MAKTINEKAIEASCANAKHSHDDYRNGFEAGANAVLEELEPLIATLRTGARKLFEDKIKELNSQIDEHEYTMLKALDSPQKQMTCPCCKVGGGCVDSPTQKCEDCPKGHLFHWKPSEEQMEALKGVQEGIFRLSILESLYNDLKKLKG